MAYHSLRTAPVLYWFYYICVKTASKFGWYFPNAGKIPTYFSWVSEGGIHFRHGESFPSYQFVPEAHWVAVKAVVPLAKRY